MNMSLLRDAGLIILACMAGIWMFEAKTKDLPETPAVVEAPVEVIAKRPAQTAMSLTLYKERGQFWTEGDVDAARVRFLVDTGASVVALTRQDAINSGVNEFDLKYTASVSTANGTTRAAPVTIRSLTVGPITQTNVRALVIEDGLDVSLLGMSFLSRLQRFESSGDTMTMIL